MNQIVAFSGPKGVGKSTLANELVSSIIGRPVHRTAFACRIKEALLDMGIREPLYSAEKEMPLPGFSDFTYRDACIGLGTWGHSIALDFWLRATKKELAAVCANSSSDLIIVIDDLRLARELEWLQSQDALIFRLTRGGVDYTNNHITEKELPGLQALPVDDIQAAVAHVLAEISLDTLFHRTDTHCTHPDHNDHETCEDRAVGCDSMCVCCMGVYTRPNVEPVGECPGGDITEHAIPN